MRLFPCPFDDKVDKRLHSTTGKERAERPDALLTGLAARLLDQPGHNAVAIADADSGLGQVQLEQADVLNDLRPSYRIRSRARSPQRVIAQRFCALARRCPCAMSASLIGRSGSSTFRLSTIAVLMSLAGSRFSSNSAPGPFHHGIRRRGGTICLTALPSERRQVQADIVGKDCWDCRIAHPGRIGCTGRRPRLLLRRSSDCVSALDGQADWV